MRSRRESALLLAMADPDARQTATSEDRPSPRAGRSRLKSILASVALVSAMLATAVGSASAARDAPLVVWLSLDGVRHDYPDRGLFPALARMERDGVRAQRFIPVFPTSTFPNHVSMATCSRVDRHGIVGNQFVDTELGVFNYGNDSRFINTEPIWSSAERQGVRSASFFWVGSETPWRGVGATYRRSPFDSGIGEAEKVDQILAWIDLPEDERPGLVLSWWHGTDRVGHLKGPDDPEIAVQLASQDAELGRLFAGLDARNAWPFTTVVVSSDHGMTSGRIEINIASVFSDEGIESRYDSDGAVAYVTLSDRSELDRAKAALELVAGHVVYRSDALPEDLHITSPGRNGDLVLVAEAPHYYSRAGTLNKWLGRLAHAFGGDRGTHGYAPDQPDMAGILYMLGRGVEQGSTLDAVSNLDIAPTVSRLLGIDPPADCEGKALYEIVGEVK